MLAAKRAQLVAHLRFNGAAAKSSGKYRSVKDVRIAGRGLQWGRR